MHGNEPCGANAVQAIRKDLEEGRLFRWIDNKRRQRITFGIGVIGKNGDREGLVFIDDE